MSKKQAASKKSVAKKQHFVPRSYMKMWSVNGKSVYIYDKVKRVYENRNIKTINCQNYFYDFLPGDIMPDEALNYIYSFMCGYTIKYINDAGENKVAQTLQEINVAYNYKTFWKIIDADGNTLNQKEKNVLLTQLDQSRCSFSEVELGKQYETQWESFIKDIEDRLRKITNISKLDNLTNVDFEKLFKYMIIYDWRGKIGDDILNEIFDRLLSAMDNEDSMIPQTERIHNEDKTIKDEIEKNYKRINIFKFLLGDEDNIIEKQLHSFQENLTFIFWLTDMSHAFITSDQPTMLIDGFSGNLEYILVATPTLLISTAKKDKGKFFIKVATDEDVKLYNKKIYDKAEMVILPDGLKRIEEFYNL